MSLNYLENLLADPASGVTKPAMVLVETIQGEGGCISASKYFFQGLREITARYDVPLVIDEIQTGLGRTGYMFAHEFADIVRDAILMSKAVGGGFPLSVVAYNKRYDSWQPGAHAGTFRGNQIALISGAAVMEYIKEPGFLESVRENGEMFMAALRELKTQYDCIGDVRGRGLMVGVEIVDPNRPLDFWGRYPANPSLTKKIKKMCLSNNLIVESGGRHDSVLRFLPPLVITKKDILDVVERFGEAVDAVYQESISQIDAVPALDVASN